MNRPLTKISLALETAHYRGTGGVSENNRSLGFQPAFIDRETEIVHLSRFPDGRLAPCHLLDGLPPELVLARDEQGRVARVKSLGGLRFRARRSLLRPRRGGRDARISFRRPVAKIRHIAAEGSVGEVLSTLRSCARQPARDVRPMFLQHFTSHEQSDVAAIGGGSYDRVLGRTDEACGVEHLVWRSDVVARSAEQIKRTADRL